MYQLEIHTDKCYVIDINSAYKILIEFRTLKYNMLIKMCTYGMSSSGYRGKRKGLKWKENVI